MTLQEQRDNAVQKTLREIKAIAGDGMPDRAALEAMKERLVALTKRTDLFPRADFPATGNEDDDTYLLSQDADGGFALYLYSSGSDGETPPHDHRTWAVIAGIEEVEHNKIYKRLDDGSTPGQGRIALDHEFSVTAGTGLALAAEDVHSIHVDMSQPVMHLHLYGKGFEFLSGRVSFDMINGTTAPYGGAMSEPAE
ncbi:MAG: cysteine dioxygenase [Alphaproteobacteria bacterium]|nr:cysteine dioxygenase [Alphaproteobacteria bacterium]